MTTNKSTATEVNLACAKKYISSIRNSEKRKYAEMLLPHFTSNIFPDRPKGLSYMAAQAVEIRLREIFNR